MKKKELPLPQISSICFCHSSFTASLYTFSTKYLGPYASPRTSAIAPISSRATSIRSSRLRPVNSIISI